MSDIEGSTRLWSGQRTAMAGALELHDGLLREAVEGSGGTVVKTTGDGLLAVFDRPESALIAAVEGQRALGRQTWPTTIPLRVRMAIHSGSAEVRDDDFFGPTLNRVARLMAIGHGGQVLVSSSTASLVADDLPPGCDLVDLGEQRLRDLDRPERVRQLVAEGLERDFPPLRTAAERPTNLRPEVTSFVGRGRELVELGRMVGRDRLVTLVGVGGTGKTRLGLRLAADALGRYRDGAWLVELAPLSDPDLVVPEIGRVLDVQPEPGRSPLDAMADHLRAKELLLFIDNCEHVIEAVAAVVDRLLGGCPGVQVLASSREPLGIDGEVVYAVPSLALPASADPVGTPTADVDAQLEAALRSEAVQLFVERATATLPTFALDRSNVRAVVDICRRLDGIPLAIELAAARINVLSADEIARGLDDRFRLLTGGRRTAVPRQRTLQALIDWSWDLLDEADQHLLRRLSVFLGGWTLDAAAAITGTQDDPTRSPSSAARLETLDGLGRLADRSLIVVTHGATTRYGMLETIGEYARDRLDERGEAADARTRHLAWFHRLAVEAEPGLEGPDMESWLLRLDTEIDNLRSALDWAIGADVRAALEMAVSLSVYWIVRLTGPEGLDRMDQAVDLARTWHEAGPPSPERSALVARVLSHAALLHASATGRPADPAIREEAAGVARESGEPTVIARTLADLAFAHVAVDGSVPPGGPEREAAAVALALAEEHGDWYRASIIAAAFAITESRVDAASTQAWLDRATETAERTGNLFALGNIVGVRGRVASRAGRLAEAERSFIEARARYRAMGDRRFERVLASELAHVLRRQGRLDEAEVEYRDTIRGWQTSGNPGAVANQLECFGFIALARGNGARAARMLGAAEALREANAAPMTDFEEVERDEAVRRLRTEIGEPSLRSEWAAGRSMTLDEAVAFALAP